MKSQHEPFDDDLRERLQSYTEEPAKDLWQGIAANIVSVNSEPRWVVWPKRISIILVGLAVVLVSYRSSVIDKIEYNPIVGLQAPLGVDRVNVQRNDFVPEHVEKQDFVSARNKVREISSKKEGFVVNLSNEQFDVKDVIAFSRETLKLTENAHQGSPDSLPGALSIPLGRSTVIANDTSIRTVKKLQESQAYENDSDQKKNLRHRKYNLYVTAMPTLGYQRIESNQTDNLIIESIDRIPAFSAKRLGVRAELGIEYPVTTKLNVFGGLLYYQRKQTISYTEKRLDSTLISGGPNGEVLIEPKYSYLDKSIEYELKNVGIQIGFNYILSRRKAAGFSSKDAISSKTIPIPRKTFLHMIGTGIEFHKALNKTNEFDRANGFSNPSAYVFYNFYYRLQYPSEGKLRAILQPTINYSFYINENLHTPFYVKPYGLGLNFGCVYNF